ncbi:MAG: hypothetical protein ACFFER_10755 [Candidatus Thorarchaeota archaeon]
MTEIQGGQEFEYILELAVIFAITVCCGFLEKVTRQKKPSSEEIELTRGICPYCKSVYSYIIEKDPKRRLVKCQNCASIYLIPPDAPTIRATPSGEPISARFEEPAVVAFGICPMCGDSSYHDVSKDRMVRCQACSHLFAIPDETPKVRVPYHPKAKPRRDTDIKMMKRLRAECPSCKAVHSFAVEENKEYHVLLCPDCGNEFTSQ